MALHCENLITWLNTFDNLEPVKSVQDLSNGVVLSKILQQISPKVFTDEWASKIKADSANNWRIKASNLKKILKGILDYYSTELQMCISDSHVPDVNIIAEKEDEIEMSKLLQLLLGCAVNCEEKLGNIQRIMSLEERVQHDVMMSIKELMLSETSQNGDGDGETLLETIEPRSSSPLPSQAGLEFKKLLEEKEALAIRCHELDHQLLMLTDEKMSLRKENEKLNQKLNQADILEDPRLWRDWPEHFTSTPLGRRLQQLQRQSEQLQDELFKSEAAKDDFRIKCEILEKDFQQLQMKNESLMKLSEESRNMRDELDILRHNSDKVAKYEVTISNLRKKLDDLVDAKSQLKMLEDKNTFYVEKNLELEEELKKLTVYKGQLEIYKRQVQDLQMKNSEEAKKSDKSEFDLARCHEKIASLQKEKEKLVEERNAFKEINEELKLMQSSQTASSASFEDEDGDMELVGAPAHIRERLIKLQHENKMLKMNSESSKYSGEVEVLRGLVEDEEKRRDELQLELRFQNRKIMELEAKVEDLTELNKQLTSNVTNSTLQETSSTFPTATASSVTTPVTVSILHATNPLSVTSLLLNNKSDDDITDVEKTNHEIGQLKKQLVEKDQEMKLIEERYKTYLIKAKTLIDHHQQQKNSSVPPDVNIISEKLTEKENYVKLLEVQLKAKEEELKLMSSAFYNLGMNLHKRNVEERLKGLSSDVPHSFLSRQRQIQSRRVSSGVPTPQHMSR